MTYVNVRRVLQVDQDPLPVPRQRHYGGELCRAGCGSAARYRGYCFQHWRQPAAQQRDLRQILESARSNRDAFRRLRWEGEPWEHLERLQRECDQLGIPTPAERVKKQAQQRRQQGRQRGRRPRLQEARELLRPQARELRRPQGHTEGRPQGREWRRPEALEYLRHQTQTEGRQ